MKKVMLIGTGAAILASGVILLVKKLRKSR